jgi:hypothetical protein
LVVTGRDFDNVHANQIDIAHRADDLQTLSGGQSARHRRAGAGCKSRIQAVDIKRQVGFVAANNAQDFLDGRLYAVAVYPLRVQDIDAEVVVVEGAYADLHRALGVDDAGLDSLVEHGAVVE